MGILHVVKLVLAGLLTTGLVIGVIVLGIEVARLSSELEELQNDDNNVSTLPPGTTTEDPSSLDPWDREYRLPASLQTEHYDLYIYPDIPEQKFTGHVTVRFSLEESLEYLAIHQKGLTIEKPKLTVVTGGGSNNVTLEDSFPADRNEFFVLTPSSGSFTRNQYELYLEFAGSLDQPEIVGIYSSRYTTPEGVNKTMVTSKFEPTYARRAFPCFDEPAKKATFTVSLVQPSPEAGVDPTWSALSNMNVDDTLTQPDTPQKGLTTIHFAPSVKMSTYLACFIVSEFSHLPEQLVPNGGEAPVPVRTYAPAHVTQFTQFALEAAVSITAHYIDYFGIPYPLPKLDLIAIPDFVSGAMEHWGLITFRESNLVFDETKSSAANQQRVGQVVAHEIAHMWFGNLVTMKWWDDLWLNEGFASYIEYKGLDQFRPDMKVVDQFLVDDLQPVMALDAQMSSHPVIQHVEHPDQITEIFDTITYSKGSSVLRMLENFLGEEVFKSGVKDYLSSFKYENAETKDLWASLQKAADVAELGVDVARVMDTWTLQMGLPVINADFDDQSKQLVLTQSRFLATPESGKKQVESPFGYKWDVPVTFRTNAIDDPAKPLWLLMENSTLTIILGGNTNWVKINADQAGFYRVNYNANMWKLLIANYLSQAIKSPLDRSSLLDDSFSLAEATLLDYNIAMGFAQALEFEVEYVPWRTADARFRQISPLMRGRLAYPKYRAFLQHISQPMYTTLGWEEAGTDDFVTRRLRSTILSFACSGGNSECLAEAGRQFQAWLDDPAAPLSPNLRQLVYVYGMQAIGEADNWNIVWGRYLAETDAQEKSRLLLALAATKEPWLLETFVQLAWSEENVRGQDYFTVLQNIADNPVGTPIIWDHVRSNWTALVDRFTTNNRYLGQMIPRITKNFATELKLKEMEIFFAEYPDAGAGESSRAQALERVEANIKWVAQHYPAIEKWLNEEWDPSAAKHGQQQD